MYEYPTNVKAAGALAGLLAFALLYGATAGAVVAIVIALTVGEGAFVAWTFWSAFATAALIGAIYGWRHP